MDFAVAVNHRMKIKESEKIDIYQDLVRELKMWNMKVMVIPIVVGALETVSKSLKKTLKIKRRIEIIQTKTLLRLVRILKKFLEA